jgi:hypothetical protein
MGRQDRKHLRILCSCDRYNYGDLLFPIVTQSALSPFLGVQYEFTPYGMARSDLSVFGALPSRGMRDLYKDTRSGDVVLLAGGENLAQSWFGMHLTLLGSDAALRREKFPKVLGNALNETLSRWRFGGHQTYPYILSPDQFSTGVRVMYNSMGGWPLKHYPVPNQHAVASSLKRASFLSVRDQESASILREIDSTLRIRVAPDCVFLLADLLPRDKLASMISPAVRDVVRDAGDFLCFQCNPRFGQVNRDELTRQLGALSAQSGLNILLVPIGRIYSFQDDTFLASLQSEMGHTVRSLPASTTIYDTMYALASAHLFCGTSLHGVITAMTYGVPLVPLLTEDPKLRNNLESWKISGPFPITPASDIAQQGLHSLGVSQAFLAEQSVQLRAAARDNMQRLAECILGD